MAPACKNGVKLTACLTWSSFVWALCATVLLIYLHQVMVREWLRSQLDGLGKRHGGRMPFVCDDVKGRESQQQQGLSSEQASTYIRPPEGYLKEVMEFQRKNRGCESLSELLSLPSHNPVVKGAGVLRIGVILVHTYTHNDELAGVLCLRLGALLKQTIPFHRLWVLINSRNPDAQKQLLIRTTASWFPPDARVQFVLSMPRHELAMETDYVYILADEDMPRSSRILQIYSHVAGTEKYRNCVLGSSGHILPDFAVDGEQAGRILEVDLLCCSWFLRTEIIIGNTDFSIPANATEALQFSYQLQKHKEVRSYVLPTDISDQGLQTNFLHGDDAAQPLYPFVFREINVVDPEAAAIIKAHGFVTQQALMRQQRVNALFYAHSLNELLTLVPIITRFRPFTDAESLNYALLVVGGGHHCAREAAESELCTGRPAQSCRDNILDLALPRYALWRHMNKEVRSTMKGILTVHSPVVLVISTRLLTPVREALYKAAQMLDVKVIELQPDLVSHALWIAHLSREALQGWGRASISINVITQNRPASLQRLLRSLKFAHYLGDRNISLTINIDRRCDTETLRTVEELEWTLGQKMVRRRTLQAGLVRAVTESWYPASDHEFGLLLEDDVEVSPLFYVWLKYTLLSYHYEPQVSLPELNAISLYTPRLVEVVRERPTWNATHFFRPLHENTPYLHQLPCSWGSLFFAKHWREFVSYVAERFTDNPKENPVQIPRSRTNGWRSSWKRFMVDMMYLRGYVTLYPNFPNQASFSTNHLEPGEHVESPRSKVEHRKEDYEVPLLQQEHNFLALLPNQRLPRHVDLPVLSLFNRVTTLRNLKVVGSRLAQDVLPCNHTQVVVVDGRTGMATGCASFV